MPDQETPRRKPGANRLVCLDVVRAIYECGFLNKRRVRDGDQTKEIEKMKYSAQESPLYRKLQVTYSFSQIDAAMRWLTYGEYVRPSMGSYELLERGCEVVEQDGFADEERKLFYGQEDPYAVFMAHQFNEDDGDIVAYIREKVLETHGFSMIDGRADGLEEFRVSILKKIRQSRFFLCLLTKRAELATGGFASSTWLYQETGMAVACNKKPLLLVERGIDSDFIGEFQKIYEYEQFTRSNHPKTFEVIIRKLRFDLESNHIPMPKANCLRKGS